MSFQNFGNPASSEPGDPRRLHPSGERNKEPILDVLRRVFPAEGLVLEIASGTGQHSAWFTEHLPGLTWQPSDHDADALPSIAAWGRHAGNGRVLPPVRLDVTETPWPVGRVDAMLCVNMLQVSPWEAALALLAGAARHLAPGGPLVIYSPLSQGGAHTSTGNADFDARLKARDPRLGVRDVDAIVAAAAREGLVHEETVAMPANNTVVVLRAGTG